MEQGQAVSEGADRRKLSGEVNPSDKVKDFQANDSFLRLEAVLFIFVVDEHPAPVTLIEAAVHLRRDPTNESQAEEVELISWQLVKAGLLHRVGLENPDPEQYAFPSGNKLLQPTKAALHGLALLEHLH